MVLMLVTKGSCSRMVRDWEKVVRPGVIPSQQGGLHGVPANQLCTITSGFGGWLCREGVRVILVSLSREGEGDAVASLVLDGTSVAVVSLTLEGVGVAVASWTGVVVAAGIVLRPAGWQLARPTPTPRQSAANSQVKLLIVISFYGILPRAVVSAFILRGLGYLH